MTPSDPGADEAAAQELPALHERPWAIGIYLAFAALVGLAWSAPLAAAIGAATHAYPRGDAEIFDPGGVMLVEALRHLRHAMPAVGAAWTTLAIAALPAGMVVIAFCLAHLAERADARPSQALARAVRSLPTLAVIGLVALVAEAALVALVMLGGGSIARSSWPDAPPRDIARWSLLALSFVLVTAAGAVHDLARAAAVTGPAKTYTSLRAALRTVRRRPARVAWSYTWRAVLGLGAVITAAWLGVRIGESAPGAVLAMALVHQIALAGMGLLRLSWLAQAIRLVTPELPVTAGANEATAPTARPSSAPALDAAHETSPPTDAPPMDTSAPPSATAAGDAYAPPGSTMLLDPQDAPFAPAAPAPAPAAAENAPDAAPVAPPDAAPGEGPRPPDAQETKDPHEPLA